MSAVERTPVWGDATSLRERGLELSLRALLDSLALATWDMDAQGRIVADGAAWRNFTGQDRDEWLRDGWLGAIHAEERAEVEQAWLAAMAAGVPLVTQCRVRSVKSGWRWTELRAAPLYGEGRLQKWLGLIVDVHDRRAAETALQKSESDARQLAESLNLEHSRLEAILQHLPVGMWIADQHGRLVARNQESDRIWCGDVPQGGDAGSSLYSAWEVATGLRLPQERYPVAQALASGRAVGPLELGIRCANGTEIRILASAAPILDRGGHRLGVVGIDVDITERAAIEATVRGGEARRAFLLALSDALRPLTDSRAIQSVACRMLAEHLNVARVSYADIEGDEFVIRETHSVGVPALKGRYPLPELSPQLLDFCRRGEPVVIEDVDTDPRLDAAGREGMHAAGTAALCAIVLTREQRWVGGFAAHSAVPRRWSPAEVNLTREVAERVWAAAARAQAENALRDSGQRLRVALAAAQMGTWRWDFAEDRFHLFLQVRRLLGGEERPVTTLRRFLEHVLVEDRADVEAAFRHTAETGVSLHVEFRVQRDDEVVWLRARGERFTGADHRSVYMTGACADITRSKAIEEALRRADRQKDEFLAMLGHELRNPLAPIQNAGDLLARLFGNDLQGAAPIAILRRQTHQLTRLVDDLLDVSRISRGQISLHNERHEIHELLEHALESVEPAMRAKQHHVALQGDAEPAFVDGDRARLVQCFANILQNAAKYTPARGEVAVELHVGAQNVDVLVRDNGEGIAPELLPYVFDLFVQGERTLDRAQGGLGIGLSVVRRLIEMHGGTVAAASHPGHGSTFTVTLPRAAAPDVRVDAPLKSPARTARILVVDDNADAADSIALLLRSAGHRVETVYSALAALEATERWKPEVIVLDLGLPRIDGLEVARRLRADPATRSIRLIALTGYGQPEDRNRTAAAGFDAHLVKPTDPDALEQTLAQLIGV